MVEMPEGWKKLKGEARYALELSKATEGNVALAYVTLAENINNAADLMKEMAEALEDIGSSAKEECTFEDIATDCGVYEVLKKFKEWR